MPVTPSAITGDIAVLPVASGADGGYSATALSTGGFVVAYTSNVSGTPQPYLQFFSAAGAAVGGPIEVAASSEASGHVSVVERTTGELLVHYGSGSSVFVQRLTAGGTAIDAPIQINSTADGGLMALANGGFVFVGATAAGGVSSHFYSPGNSLVFVQGSSSTNGSATRLANGDVFVAFQRSSSDNIRGVSYIAGGQEVRAFDISQFDTFVSSPAAATLADGRVVVAFSDRNAELGDDISLRIINADGTASTSQIAVHSVAGQQVSPSVVALADGGFIVSWIDQSGLDGDGAGVLARRYDSAGAALGSIFVVTAATAGDQGQAALGRHSVIQLTNGDVVFVSSTPGAGGSDLTLRLFDVEITPILGTAGDDLLDGTADADIIEAGGGSDIVNGLDGDDQLFGQGGKDFLYGGLGADTLDGGDGGDLLDGGAGDDVMAGGAGDDTYVVDSAGDTLTEVAGQGIDRVRAGVNFTLGAELEHLQLTGAALTGQGNGLDNQLDGNASNNDLRGGGGNDIVRGAGGADTLFGEAGDDMVLGEDGDDSLDGGDDHDRLYGDRGNDTLYGQAGDDILQGGADQDYLYGGDGADQLFGGDFFDALYGDAGNDRLDGGTGADYMEGGTGDDTYYVDSAGDNVVEASSQGNDVVRSRISFTLGANVERLILEGVGFLNATGNGADNQITGNSGYNILRGLAGKDTIHGGGGDDIIYGGTGADIITGGTGADSFIVLQESVFSSLAPNGATLEIDTISDFAAGVDIIDLSAITSGDADGAFSLAANFSRTAGEMTLKFAGGITTLSLDIDGDARADYQLRINGDVTGASGDWLL